MVSVSNFEAELGSRGHRGLHAVEVANGAIHERIVAGGARGDRRVVVGKSLLQLADVFNAVAGGWLRRVQALFQLVQQRAQLRFAGRNLAFERSGLRLLLLDALPLPGAEAGQQ